MKRLKRGFALILTAMIFCICILSHGVDVYAKTKKFNVTKSQMLNTVSKYSVGVMVNGKEQRFKVKKTEVEQFTVKSKKYFLDFTYQNTPIHTELHKVNALTSFYIKEIALWEMEDIISEKEMEESWHAICINAKR